MIEAIKENHEKRYIKCVACGSIFSFDDEEVWRIEKENNTFMMVTCPVCCWDNVVENYNALSNSTHVFSVNEEEYKEIEKRFIKE